MAYNISLWISSWSGCWAHELLQRKTSPADRKTFSSVVSTVGEPLLQRGKTLPCVHTVESAKASKLGGNF